jgi:hypothetical protein
MTNWNFRSQPRDPYSSGDRYSPRVYAYETVDPEYQDSGANDEGYFYQWCDSCQKRTEHDSYSCIACETR